MPDRSDARSPDPSHHEPSHQQECLEGDEVLALLQEWSNIKLSGNLAILCMTGKLPVNIEIDVGCYTTEVSDDALAIQLDGILISRR